MKSDVTDVGANAQRHTEGLNRPIEVLVIQRILVVVDAGTWIGDFVTHKPDAIVSRIRLHLIYHRARPSHDSGLHPHRRANTGKCEIGRAAGNIKPAIGSIVEHVALAGMRLAPRVFGRSHVLRFTEIGCTRIL
jgi:hypothetical protein